MIVYKANCNIVCDEDGSEDGGAEDGDEDEDEDTQHGDIRTCLLRSAAELVMMGSDKLASLMQLSQIPVINIDGLKPFQRLLSALLYFSTKKNEQPSMTYSQVEEFCRKNKLGEVTPLSVIVISSSQLKFFGIKDNFARAIINFAKKYSKCDELSDDLCLSLDTTSLFNRIASVTGLGNYSAFLMIVFGLHRFNFLPWDVYNFRKALPKEFTRKYKD
ncbi:hypothetical protein POM88_038544 [Heracleum sosnowskyi]|uniref:HhH-GPD domain-containing protein n=1 Tax=Heracleum sosnowskyi TaxID=360622 RepID=A0AAD8HB22_9APIA|nr:hypothetical protein POM88_038544 [Heracleum sosnowskyi]